MPKSLTSNTTAVIPCYNDGAFILKALDSLLGQTLPPDRVIIIDDGSNTQTIKVLQSINHENVIVHYQDNQGVCKTRNKAISKVKTPYVLTLDADDYFEPTFLEKALKIINEKPDVAAVCCYYKEFGAVAHQKKIIKPLGGSVTDFLVKNNGMASTLFRKQCWAEVNGYDEAFKQGYEDWDFWLSILANNWIIYSIPEVLFNYRKKKSSRDISAKTKHDYELRIKLYEKHKGIYNRHKDNFTQQLLWRYSNANAEVIRTKQTLDYRLGALLLKPFRRIKKLF